MAKQKKKADANYVSEWFGHRIFPTVVSTEQSVSDQRGERCPFLSIATQVETKCVKAPASRGVCAISSASNGARQDWLVCPYRVISSGLMEKAIALLFGNDKLSSALILPALSLTSEKLRTQVGEALENKGRVFIYFDKKTGGELSYPGTSASPEFSFDVTIVELEIRNGMAAIGKFGILEIQTMDFHGTYRNAVRNLSEGLRMHPKDFGETLAANDWWAGEGVEGPNIANVFKRTFYQMMFKFQLGAHDRCAGCVLALPQSVWDSWQKHLGNPKFRGSARKGNWLGTANNKFPTSPVGWVVVFEPDAASPLTPSPIKISTSLATNTKAMSYWALEVAPKAALAGIETGFFALLARRISEFWPELGTTVGQA